MFSQNELVILAILAVLMVIALSALVLSLRAYMQYARLNRKYDFFMKGKDAESLEDYIMQIQEEVDYLQEEDQKTKDMLRVVNRNIRASFQKFGIVKYNAFKGMGGNMSFAIAVLDYTNTGFVMNCVHSRDGCFVYMKVVDAGTTDTQLGVEEKEALEQALGYKERELV